MKRVANLWLCLAIITGAYCGLWKGWTTEDYSIVSIYLIIHYGENLIYYIKNNEEKINVKREMP